MGVITIQIAVNKIDRNKGQIGGLPKNPRFIRDEKFELLKKSIQENPEMLGLRELLVYPVGERYVIIGGNMRYEACKALGYTSIPCKVLDADTPVETLKAYTIKDNAGFGEWDWDMLANEWDIAQLTEWGVDVPEWETEEESQPEAKEDDFDEEKSEIEKKVSVGEIWQLGEHRLMCGDSTIAENFEMLLDGEKADLCFTSPPYNNAGHAITTGNFTKGSVSQKLYDEQGYSDDRESSDYIKLCRDVLDNMFKFTDGYIFWNVNYNANARTEYIQQIIDKLDYLSDLICWKKRMAITNTRGGLTRIWEPIFVFSTDKTPLKVNCILNNHWEVDNVNASYENHRACFPVALPGKAIQSVAKEVNIVIEPFGGTGSTLIACEQLGKQARLMELDPYYCDVIIARWEKLTGQKATKL